MSFDFTKNIVRFKNFEIGIAFSFFELKGWSKRQGTRGYKFFAEGYVHNLVTCDLTIKAQCWRSQKKNLPPHKLHFSFSEEEISKELKLKEARCSCEAGNSESCNHLVALAHYLQDLNYKGVTEIQDDMPTCTSLPMKWNKPRGKKIVPESIASSVFQRPLNISRKKDPVKSTFRIPFKNLELHNVSQEAIELQNSLRDKNLCISYLLSNKKDSLMVPVLQGTTTSQQGSALELMGISSAHTAKSTEAELVKVASLPITLPNVDQEICNILSDLPPVSHRSLREIDFSEAETIERNTRLQSMDAEWHRLRQYRFTASNFGFICHRQLFNGNFVKMFTHSKNISHVKSVKHGTSYESLAVELYLSATEGAKFFKCGLVIHPYAVHLGSSPDGVIYKEGHGYGLLEVKCPCSEKASNLHEYLQLKSFCLKEKDGEYILKENHNYFYQVQGQMLICGLRWCDFVVFIEQSHELIIVNIPINLSFCGNMYCTLTKIYKEHISILP